MSNKKIETWKGQVANRKTIFVATKVKTIDPVVDAIVKNLCEIDLIQSVMTALPDEWEACVVMDWSEGFWERMAEKYDGIEVL